MSKLILTHFSRCRHIYRMQWTASGCFGTVCDFFVCVWNISGTAQRICAKFEGKTRLVRRSNSLHAKVKGQGHRDKKTAFFGPIGACVWFTFRKTLFFNRNSTCYFHSDKLHINIASENLNRKARLAWRTVVKINLRHVASVLDICTGNFLCLQCFDAVGWEAGIQPVKKLSGEVLAWLSVWSEVKMICIWSSWCHCRPIACCFIKIQNGLPFWFGLTQVVLKRRPLKECCFCFGYRWLLAYFNC